MGVISAGVAAGVSVGMGAGESSERSEEEGEVRGRVGVGQEVERRNSSHRDVSRSRCESTRRSRSRGQEKVEVGYK